MSKKLQKSLREYLSKIKKENSYDHHFPQIKPLSFAGNHRKLSKIFSGCKHQPKTLSFAIDHNYTLPGHRKKEHYMEGGGDERGEATLADVDRFLVENFKSLYGNKDGEKGDDSLTSDQSVCSRGSQEENNRLGGYLFDKSSKSSKDEPHFGSIPIINDGACCSSDSTTSTYVHKSPQPLMCLSEKDARVPDDCIVVLKQSSSLYEDFRNSMKGLIEARLVEETASADGEFLKEILLCFLNLNERKYYRYIVHAFVDLTADLRRVTTSHCTERGAIFR